jgi:hypothetical protein
VKQPTFRDALPLSLAVSLATLLCGCPGHGHSAPVVAQTAPVAPLGRPKLPQGYESQRYQRTIVWRSPPGDYAFLEKLPAEPGAWKIKAPKVDPSDTDWVAQRSVDDEMRLYFTADGLQRVVWREVADGNVDLREFLSVHERLDGPARREKNGNGAYAELMQFTYVWVDRHTEYSVEPVGKSASSGPWPQTLIHTWRYLP